MTKLFRSRRFGLILLWTAVIICVTTMPWSNFKGHSHWSRVRWIPFHDHPLAILDVAGNILLFVPFGLFFVQSQPKSSLASWLQAVLFAWLLSTSVEFFQVYCHNRFPSMTDILTNVIGAAIGAAIGVSRQRRS